MLICSISSPLISNLAIIEGDFAAKWAVPAAEAQTNGESYDAFLPPIIVGGNPTASFVLSKGDADVDTDVGSGGWHRPSSCTNGGIRQSGECC